jgi:PAS domain S-box-containing protein
VLEQIHDRVQAALAPRSQTTAPARVHDAESEALRLRLALDAANVGIHEYHPRTGAIVADARCREIFWLQPDETWSYERFLAGVHPDDRAEVEACVAAALDPAGTRRYDAEYRVVDPATRRERWVHATGVVLFLDGAPVRLHGTVADVTARKAAEQTFRAFADAIPQLVWLTTSEGENTYVNRQWCEYFGVASAREPAAKGLGWLDMVHPDDRDAAMREWTAAVDTGGHYQVEYRLRAGDGTYRWFLARAVPERDSHGRVIRWFGTSTDIDERKRMEAERERYLESERAARAHVEHASRLKEEFLATLSHELRTPLNTILGWTHLLARRPDAERVREGVAVIARSARAQAKLVDDLLDMSRVAAGKLRIASQVTSLDRIVDSALESVRNVAAERGLALERAGDRGEMLHADAARLEQVFANLLTNAVKFTPGGGRIVVEVRAAGDSVQVCVHDTGRGIPASFLPHVFDRFRQADGSDAREYGGLGIGLAIAKTLVELHGGTIEARSRGPDLGSTFTVTLPRATGPLAATLPEESAAPSIRGVRVLVVDDDDDVRLVLARLLEDAGACVEVADSAESTLATLDRAQPPDVLLTDLGMPRVNGYELLRAARAAGHTMPAIAVTAFMRADDRALSESRGFAAHLGKPVDPLELQRAIAAALDRAE